MMWLPWVSGGGAVVAWRMLVCLKPCCGKGWARGCDHVQHPHMGHPFAQLTLGPACPAAPWRAAILSPLGTQPSPSSLRLCVSWVYKINLPLLLFFTASRGDLSGFLPQSTHLLFDLRQNFGSCHSKGKKREWKASLYCPEACWLNFWCRTVLKSVLWSLRGTHLPIGYHGENKQGNCQHDVRSDIL